MALRLKYGIPDIELPRVGGGTVNPGCFAGHALVVVFCPTDHAAEVRELEDYAGHASEWTGNDAWVLTVGKAGASAAAADGGPLAIASDPDCGGWDAFRAVAGSAAQLRRDEGATFLFGRGGALQRVWPGSGHSADLLDQLADRGAATEELSSPDLPEER